MNLEILYEDNHLLIINKPPGLLSQGDKTGDNSILDFAKKYIKIKYNKPGNVYLGLPHRLDRPSSGVLVLARTSKALSRLNKMFNRGDIKKIYWAVVDNSPPKKSDTLTNFLIKNRKKNKSKAFNKKIDGSKKAILRYNLISSSDNYFLVEIELLTGRHHQIRAQLAKIGLHIKGDLKYGAKRSNKNGGIHLHSRKMEFNHPVSEKIISVTANTPKDNLWDIFS